MKLEIRLYDENLKQAILNLPYSTRMDSEGNDCDMIFIPESDYGFAEIYRMYDDILIFGIPMYGGTPSLILYGDRLQVDNLVAQLRV